MVAIVDIFVADRLEKRRIDGDVFFSQAGRGIRYWRDWSSDVCSSDLNAMAAFARGDYAGALPEFSTYLKESKAAEEGPATADVEALLAYGKSRQAIPMPRARHMTEADRKSVV